jgi:hypothetical protein
MGEYGVYQDLPGVEELRNLLANCGHSRLLVAWAGTMMASIAFAFLALALQNSHDGDYGVPIPCRHGPTEQFVDLAKIANRFHVTTVHSEDESVFRRDNSHEPLPARRKCAWNGSQAPAGFRQDTYESNNIRAWRLGSKRIFHLQAD